MADLLQVELVAADRVVWSGEAEIILTRTVDGELGVMANHAPLLSVLAPGTVEIRTVEGADVVAAVDGGFLSVAANRVSILAGHAGLAGELDLEQARRELEEARSAQESDEDPTGAVRDAEAWVQAIEKAS
jgi:F-type H+-transporting ATPase subunit epsilon